MTPYEMSHESREHWWYCTVLYCTVLYCTVLYCTVPVPVPVLVPLYAVLFFRRKKCPLHSVYGTYDTRYSVQYRYLYSTRYGVATSEVDQ
jgi:hypothetical protein